MKMGGDETVFATAEIEDRKKQRSIVFKDGKQVGDNFGHDFDKGAADALIEDCTLDFARFRWLAEYKRDVGEALYVARGEDPAAWTVGAIPEPTGIATGTERLSIFSGRDAGTYAEITRATALKDAIVNTVPDLTDDEFTKLCQDTKGKMNQALGDAEFQRRIIQAAHQRWYEAPVPQEFMVQEKRRFPSKPCGLKDSKKQGRMWVTAIIQFSGTVPSEYPAMGSFHTNRETVTRRRGGGRARG